MSLDLPPQALGEGDGGGEYSGEGRSEVLQDRVRLLDWRVPGESGKHLHIRQPVPGPTEGSAVTHSLTHSYPVWQVGKRAERREVQSTSSHNKHLVKG